MSRRSVGFKIGFVTCLLHVAWVLLAFAAYIKSHSSTAALVFIPFFVLDAPIQLLLLLLPDSVLQFSVTVVEYSLAQQAPSDVPADATGR